MAIVFISDMIIVHDTWISSNNNYDNNFATSNAYNEYGDNNSDKMKISLLTRKKYSI